MSLHRLYDAGLHKQIILYSCYRLLVCQLYRVDTLPFMPAKIQSFWHLYKFYYVTSFKMSAKWFSPLEVRELWATLAIWLDL